MTTNGALVQVGSTLTTAAERVDLSLRFTAEQKRVILDTCCGGAPESEARALIAIAEARGLNPILGECYFVSRWDGVARRDKWSVQAAIDSFRIKAEQTGLYAGQDEPEYEYDAKGNITLARVRVWRKDWPRPAVGVARWSEYVQTTKDGNPTKFWRQMPHNQLAKCAEALALRKAFPAVLSKVYTPEEMAQADNTAPYVPPQIVAATADGEIIEPKSEPDLTKQLQASVDWDKWAAEHLDAIQGAPDMGSLNAAWADVNEDKKKLQPPAPAIETLRKAKDAKKAELTGGAK